ncbi:glycerol-3-phosphate acyltransferase 1-like [Magnolia sinica]|uniref:glycerol-3-phosphate acyltransferase 1-like n=1 Tax=Magnolia sinica TaxID=86752 RepID=UPI00265B22C1|nr:glycerol-3-phosphate acyltransferase 1-like [Magnolia sinica]
MVFPMVLLKLADWAWYQLLAHSFYRAARKIGTYGSLFNNNNQCGRSHQGSTYPSVSKCPLECNGTKTLVCDIHGTLLRTPSFFPYFMLVAFEGGSIFRALVLLLSCPLLWVLDHELGLRVMVFVTFCGLRLRDMESVGRAVLPKFFLENMNLHAYEVLASTGRRVVFTSIPRVMVEGFLKEYLSVDVVEGTELHVFGDYYTGFFTDEGVLVKHKAVKEVFGESKPDIGLGGSGLNDNLFMSLCKEAYVVSNEDRKTSASSVMPRHKYPKPLVFHDGRLAFLPTPMATLSMFLWLPAGIILAIYRLLVGIFLPYKIVILLGSWIGVHIRIKGCTPSRSATNKTGVLYVCTHRTLLDPVFLSTALGKPMTAVTYSLSKMSEFIAPIKTVRLTRDRKQDGVTMQRLLSEGDLVVCPEGTTCREPYLLRFSSLFAELADEIVPVAINTHVGMFYGTTASGLKCLDPIFFLMNPCPTYVLEFLGKVPRELTCAGGKSSCEVANHIQRQLADALGFECTTLTRRDKYMMLAGNEGVVCDMRKKPNNTCLSGPM